MQTNELRVFISSTFRDLQIVRICLEEIDRCRPYFIGILGERDGWTPLREEVEPLVGEHPHLDEFTDSDERAVDRLNDLKLRIRRSGLPVREDFASAAELGEWIQQDLLRVIDDRYPESQAPSAVELERRAHHAFAASRKRAYIANTCYLMEFVRWVGSGEQRAGSVLRSKVANKEVVVVEEKHPHLPEAQPLAPGERVFERTRGPRVRRSIQSIPGSGESSNTGIPANPGDPGTAANTGRDVRRMREDREEALRLYRQLIEKTPKHEYRKRIEELTASAGGDHA